MRLVLRTWARIDPEASPSLLGDAKVTKPTVGSGSAASCPRGRSAGQGSQNLRPFPVGFGAVSRCRTIRAEPLGLWAASPAPPALTASIMPSSKSREYGIVIARPSQVRPPLAVCHEEKGLWICGQRKSVAHKLHRPNNNEKQQIIYMLQTQTLSTAL
jgi:hypothetical protein